MANNHVKEILELLTFDEFGDFADEAECAENKDKFIRLTDEAAKRSTLRSQATPDGDASITWQTVSGDQVKKIRLP